MKFVGKMATFTDSQHALARQMHGFAGGGVAGSADQPAPPSAGACPVLVPYDGPVLPVAGYSPPAAPEDGTLSAAIDSSAGPWNGPQGQGAAWHAPVTAAAPAQPSALGRIASAGWNAAKGALELDRPVGLGPADYQSLGAWGGRAMQVIAAPLDLAHRAAGAVFGGLGAAAGQALDDAGVDPRLQGDLNLAAMTLPLEPGLRVPASTARAVASFPAPDLGAALKDAGEDLAFPVDSRNYRIGALEPDFEDGMHVARDPNGAIRFSSKDENAPMAFIDHFENPGQTPYWVSTHAGEPSGRDFRVNMADGSTAWSTPSETEARAFADGINTSLGVKVPPTPDQIPAVVEAAQSVIADLPPGAKVSALRLGAGLGISGLQWAQPILNGLQDRGLVDFDGKTWRRTEVDPGSTPPSLGPVDIRSQAFQDWFSGSKVVNSRGKPKKVFHGSRADIGAFASENALGQPNGNAGIYFTPSAEIANDYANLPRPGGDSNLTPAYVRITNPFYVGPKGAKLMKAEQIAKIRAAGHDGIIDPVSHEIVVFDPRQVKSAIANSGNFDPTDPRITRAGGGIVDGLKRRR